MCLKTESRHPQRQIAGIQSAILDDGPKTNYLGNVQVFMKDIYNLVKVQKRVTKLQKAYRIWIMCRRIRKTGFDYIRNNVQEET